MLIPFTYGGGDFCYLRIQKKDSLAVNQSRILGMFE